jgi:heme-degrading monooxygenase HmoA
MISRRKLPTGELEAWKKRFAEAAPLRKAAGCQGVRRYRSIEDPDVVVVIMQWDSVENCRRFVGQRLGEAASSLDSVFVEEIDSLDS